MRGGIRNPFYTCFNLEKTKFNQLVTKMRLHIPWSVFCGMDDRFFDIIISADTLDGKNFSWSLRNDSKIGNTSIYTDHSRLVLTFYYENMFQFFLNAYFLENIKEYLQQQGAIINLFQIKKVTYSSLTENSTLTNNSNIINTSTIYSWKA